MGVCGGVSVGSGMLRNMLLTLVSAAAAHGCDDCSSGFLARCAASCAAHLALRPVVTRCSPLRINLRATHVWLLSRAPIIVWTMHLLIRDATRRTMPSPCWMHDAVAVFEYF